jgi:peptide/nickel transport system permease protein
MWRKFRKHKLAIVGGSVLVVMYILAIFCEFFATQDIFRRNTKYIHTPPQRIHFVDAEGKFHIRPFVYDLDRSFDPETLDRVYTENTAKKNFIYFFIKGDPYKMWGFIKGDIHLFGINEGVFYLLGSDELGRDMYSRILQGARVSLSIGLIGVFVSFVMGCILGGISGYFGGAVDMIIQRIIDFLISIPTLPLWMALSAALPIQWHPIQIYFFITLILSIVGWTGLARVVRGKLMSVREEDFVIAARIAGATEGRIIVGHLLPSFLSYLIVNITLRIPGMILGETALSFLGLGLRPPVISWGVMLKNTQNAQSIIYSPWMLIPALFVIVTVLCFNFVGDGLRDAADPYK